MQVAERRKSRRYSISDDRAECMAIVGRREHRAILSDTSASGFGLMLLSGVGIEPEQRLRLVTNDGIHDCRIAYTRREEALQYLGVERLADVSLVEMPRRGKRKGASDFGIDGNSPFLFLGVILGLVSMAAVVLLGMDVSNDEDDETVVIIDQTPQPTAEDREALRDQASRAANKSVRVIDSYFDELTFEQRVSFNSTVTQANLSWDDLVSGLKLTRKQQRNVIELIKEQAGLRNTKQQRFIEMRDGIRGVLDEDQQQRFDRMWVKRQKKTKNTNN